MPIKSFLRAILLPWWIVLLPRRKGVHPYFGPLTLRFGGPDLKIRKLKRAFGNAWWPSHIYVTSGKPIAARFLRLAKQRGIKIILNQDGVFYPAWYKGDYHAMNAHLRDLHELADFVIYQSQFCQTSCQQWVNPPLRPMRLLYNAVDPTQFSMGATLPTQPFRILACSYFNRSNDYVLSRFVDVLETVVEQQGPAELIIAGKVDRGIQIPKTADLSEKTRRQGGSIRYYGAFSQTEAPTLYREAHVLIHLKYMDPCPTTVLEAMACGLPVVYNDSGGTPELVGDCGCGAAVNGNYEHAALPDAEVVARAIKIIANAHPRYRNAARERVKQSFDHQEWLRSHQDIFKNVG